MILIRALRLFVLAGVVCLSAMTWAQSPFSIQPTTNEDSKSMPAGLLQLLDPNGTRLLASSNGLEGNAIEVWWRDGIPVASKASADSDLLYGKLQQGNLIGVLRFPPESSSDYREDFRDQKIRPGFYTMRYAQMPKDKEHKDVSPYRDFVILSPINLDKDYTRVLPMDELLERSRIASRSEHPAVLSLVPVKTIYKDFPGLLADDTGRCVLQVKLHLNTSTVAGKRSELPLAIVLVTPEKDEGGS
jgi:hypothetical protein